MHDFPNTPFFIDGDIAVGQNADGRLQVFARGFEQSYINRMADISFKHSYLSKTNQLS